MRFCFGEINSEADALLFHPSAPYGKISLLMLGW